MQWSQRASAMAAHAGNVFLHGLPLDALEREAEVLDMLRRKDVFDAFRRYLAPSKLRVVVIGDPRTTLAQLGDEFLQWSP